MKLKLSILAGLLALRIADAGNVGVGVVGDNVTINTHASVGTTSAPGDLNVTGPTGSAATIPTLKATGDGGVFFPAGTNTTLAPIATTPGFFYYPAKNALRVGPYWNLTNASVGLSSAGFGGATASGGSSLAAGYYSTAAGENSFAIGYYVYVSGYSSVAAGYSVYASGMASQAFGGSTAYGDYSSAFGESNTATGYASAVFGQGTSALAAYSLAIGRYNVAEGDPAGLGATDPLFVIGNGTGPAPAQRSNAFVVYKNGDVKISKAQGDILMGEFGN